MVQERRDQANHERNVKEYKTRRKIIMDEGAQTRTFFKQALNNMAGGDIPTDANLNERKLALMAQREHIARELRQLKADEQTHKNRQRRLPRARARRGWSRFRRKRSRRRRPN